ncbi:hypothetical protein H310_08462 [Aphanomyces invadans]|uniref:Uncharacterized protein n=1 Tax=Aphanomyces invadans TaxID=157072 RepID=A0A024TYD6_9STRA|nr:hypothetical protein H310_08462 [Aphanomyces invadans]ETV98989.1 hypothetical protein H310_08462 [Aphanomyces invadans]|eukprot:XP_008872417.1 hypothetical protein H310_08462 [Aphanomyces invadans]
MQPDKWRVIVPVVMLMLNQSETLVLPGPTKTTTLEELWSLRQVELKSLVTVSRQYSREDCGCVVEETPQESPKKPEDERRRNG